MPGAAYFRRAGASLHRLAPRGARFKSTPFAASAGAARGTQASDRGAGGAGGAGGQGGRVKPVGDIPGPLGLPYIGTMLEYRLGQ